MRCNHCKKDLPENEFSPSRIKLKYHTCKKCESIKEARYRNNKILADESINDFNKFYGGYTVLILNYTKPNEYKYTIKSTDGFMIQTNDDCYFREKLNELVLV